MVKDNIQQYIAGITLEFDRCQDMSIYSAEQIASVMKLKRNTVSGYLNQLAAEGSLVKINSRPVYFLERAALEQALGVPVYADSFSSPEEVRGLKSEACEEQDVFSSLTGSHGSLRQVINQMKIAVKYPPNGLPILIQGNTGVGKSHIAQLAWQYAVSQGILKPDAPFLTFNCAQYYNNAELLSSNLFGYIKGSFTGASSDKTGLLEDADNGILFMDEVHRLSPEGQEKLFTFLDKGVFRRMGETSGWRTSRVRFIFASNLDSSSYMLQTLYRRIPIVVKIPDLKDRVREEKLQMIYLYFIREAKNLGQPVLVSRTVLSDMLEFQYEGNIGELINIVQYVCGNALINSRDSRIRVTRACYPAYLLAQIPARMGGSEQSGEIEIAPDARVNSLVRLSDPGASLEDEFFSGLLQAYQLVKTGQTGRRQFESELDWVLDRYLDQLYFRKQNYGKEDLSYLDQILEQVFRQMEFQSGVTVASGPRFSLALHLTYRRACPWDEADGGRELYQLAQYIRDVYPDESRLGEQLSVNLQQQLEQRCTQKDKLFFTVFFRNIQVRSFVSRTRSLILCHGYSTASSIANVCNRVFKLQVFEAVDMPMDITPGEVTDIINEHLRQMETGQELLLLVDTGSLKDIYQELENSVITIGVISNVSTGLALDIGNRIIQHESLDNLLEASIQNNLPDFRIFRPATQKQRLILTTCMSGEGTAQKIQHMLEEGFFDVPSLRIRSMDFHHLKDPAVQNRLKREFTVLAVVGTDNPRIKDVPFISVEQLILGRDEGSLEHLFGDSLTKDHMQRINNRLLANFSLENMVGSITIIDARVLLQDIEVLISRFERYMNLTLPNDLKINLFIHISAMMERLVRANPIREYNGLEEMNRLSPDFAVLFKRAFSIMAQKYGVEVNEEEIGIIYEIIKNANEAEQGGIL